MKRPKPQCCELRPITNASQDELENADQASAHKGPILRGLSAAASFHSIRHHVGLPVAVVVAALAAVVAAASASTDR